MTLVSYAQNCEDVMLWRALGRVDRGFYVDVGAAWPSADSVTKLFHERGWTGINIEPNPALFDQLVSERPSDINLGVAIADRPGRMTMAVVDDTGLSTFVDEFAGAFRQEGRTVTSTEVEIRTLAEVLATHVGDDQEIHFLKIDVEGFEEQVIAGNDWTTHRPWIVVVEATRPTSQELAIEWEPLLIGAGYQLAYGDGINRFYIADEHDDLRASFAAPPNVFDGFITAAHARAESRASEFEVEMIRHRHRADTAEAETFRLREHVLWLEDVARRLEARLDATQLSLLEGQRHIGALEAGRDEQQRTISALAAHHGENAARGRWISELEAHVDNLERHIEAMYRSSSWRASKPLRLASTLARDPRSVARRLLRRGAAGTGTASERVVVEPPSAGPPPSPGASSTPSPIDPSLSTAGASILRQIESDLGHAS